MATLPAILHHLILFSCFFPFCLSRNQSMRAREILILPGISGMSSALNHRASNLIVIDLDVATSIFSSETDH